MMDELPADERDKLLKKLKRSRLSKEQRLVAQDGNKAVEVLDISQQSAKLGSILKQEEVHSEQLESASKENAKATECGKANKVGIALLGSRHFFDHTPRITPKRGRRRKRKK